MNFNSKGSKHPKKSPPGFSSTAFPQMTSSPPPSASNFPSHCYEGQLCFLNIYYVIRAFSRCPPSYDLVCHNQHPPTSRSTSPNSDHHQPASPTVPVQPSPSEEELFVRLPAEQFDGLRRGPLQTHRCGHAGLGAGEHPGGAPVGVNQAAAGAWLGP